MNWRTKPNEQIKIKNPTRKTDVRGTRLLLRIPKIGAGLQNSLAVVYLDRTKGDAVGLKDWLAKNVAGISAYREVMGRECVKHGLALGQYLYPGHGISVTPLDRFIFKAGSYAHF